MKPIKLTHTETSHILSLISNNETVGWYFAPKEQYWKRSERIKAKLLGSYPVDPMWREAEFHWPTKEPAQPK